MLDARPVPDGPGGAGVAEVVAGVVEHNADWLRRYALYLALADTVVLGVLGIVSVLLRFGDEAIGPGGPTLQGTSYFAVAGLLAVGWVGVLALSRCYERRFLGTGNEEYRRVLDACLRTTAGVGVLTFAFDLPVARGFGAPFLLLGTAGLLAVRGGARALLRRQRRRGRCVHRVLVVGGHRQAAELTEELMRESDAGYVVVGACVPAGSVRASTIEVGTVSVPVVGTLTGLVDALLEVRADSVAVAPSPGLGRDALRRLSYELEGSGVDLLVAPALTNVSGTRVSIRPVAGLPLLHLEEPELTGARRAVKTAFDLTVATLLLVALAPLLLALAVLVRLSSPGPAVFSQERVGRRGRPFRVYKFRSMHVDAEQRLAELAHLNEHDGVLFKLRDDPRVTAVGRLLRRYSLDELPQLLNVLRGHMSLVGPRPPLASEVAQYEGHAERRLLVKPGITGLWQVSGRSDLSWEEAVRLDLRYVETWSLGLDIAVLIRTASAVLARRGAY